MSRDFVATSWLIYNSPLASSYPVSFACWFNEDNVGNGSLIAMANNATNNNYIMLVYVLGSYVGAQMSATTDGVAQSTSAPTANTWQHAVATFTSQTSRAVYLNGGNKGTNATDIGGFSFGMDNTTLGMLRRQTPVNQYDGEIAEAAIWSATLTDDEATILAAGYSPLLVRPESLVAYWPLMGKSFPEIDIVGGYNMSLGSGTVNGTPQPAIFHAGAFIPPPLVSVVQPAAPEALYVPRHGVVVPDLGGMITL